MAGGKHSRRKIWIGGGIVVALLVIGGYIGSRALQPDEPPAVAFSMYPVSVEDLMRVSDAGGIMPPKSTWFEPKLRDGLLSHLI